MAEQEKPKQEEGKLWVDPWSESARRLNIEPREKGPNDDDTVDIDPSDLGPDDIEPHAPLAVVIVLAVALEALRRQNGAHVAIEPHPFACVRTAD